jgi:hypothetical protein
MQSTRCFSYTAGTAGASGGPGYTDLEMVREMSAAPDWMVGHMRTARSRCNPQECDAASAPAWKLEALSGNLPKGPEVSFGIPFRWSAARYVCVCVLFALFELISNSFNASTSNSTGPKFTDRHVRVNAKHNPVQLLHAQADAPLFPLALEFSASAPAAWHGGHLFSIYFFYG